MIVVISGTNRPGSGTRKVAGRWREVVMQGTMLLMALAVFTVNAQTPTFTFRSATNQTALLELYTSEGCSSCPPAEAWLSGLKASPGLWQSFVPVAFHVDYWDYLGWRDPWGARASSDRQRSYAEDWHSESIYTPGFVLDGKEWREWPGLKDGPKPGRVRAGVLTVSSLDTNHWQVIFAPVRTNGANYEVHAALLACGLASDVKGGENRGRLLKHDFAVLNLVNAPLHSTGAMVRGDFVLPMGRIVPGGNPSLAVWITRAGRLEPAQATGGWLTRPAPAR